jgi:hypothetical protein
MAKYIEQQLEDQKKLLYLDIPTLRNHNSLMRKLRLNPRSELDLTLLDKQLIGNSPLHKKSHRRYQTTADVEATDDVDERSGVDDFVVKSTENSDLNGSSENHTHNVSLITEGGYTNPLAFNTDDLNDSESDEYGIYIGAMPTPCSEGVCSLAVWKEKFCWLLSINFGGWFWEGYPWGGLWMNSI